MLEIDRVGADFGFAGATFRATLDDPGGLQAVAVKLWSPSGPDDAREVHFYRELAGATPLPLPRYHAGAADPAAGRAWLVVDLIEGFRQGDDLVEESPASVLALVDAIAGVHAAWWERLGDRPWLPDAPRFRRDPQYLVTRRTEFLQRFGPITHARSSRVFDAIPDLLLVADSMLDGAPGTLVHGDLGLDNVLFVEPGGRPLPIDWAHCGCGPGVFDLASILFGIAPVDRLDEVTVRYVVALERCGLDVEPGSVWRWLDGAMIHEFVTRTLGVARWAADTPRGLRILDRWLARVPHVVDAWSALGRTSFTGR